jgi:hypothetical protein
MPVMSIFLFANIPIARLHVDELVAQLKKDAQCATTKRAFHPLSSSQEETAFLIEVNRDAYLPTTGLACTAINRQGHTAAIIAGMTTQPAPSLIAATVDDLRRHSPFDEMDLSTLHYLAVHLSLAYYAAGETLLSPDRGTARTLYIVQKGLVQGRDGHQGGSNEAQLNLSAGECFPIGALISRRASALKFVAAEDTFCYQLPIEGFEHVMDVSRRFRDYF